jgi:Putative peptidoglycan binding domain
MADDQNEKPQVVRSPEPGVEAAREAEERRRVAEIEREIEELGRALEGRDRLARFDRAERAESSPAQAGQSAGGVGDRSTPEPEPLPTVADMSSAPKEVSPQVGKFATIPVKNELSIQLAARAARRAESPPTLVTGSETDPCPAIGIQNGNRQTNLKEHDIPLSWFKLVLAFAIGAATSGGGFYFFQGINPQLSPPSPSAIEAMPSQPTQIAIVAVPPPPFVVDPAPAVQPPPEKVAPEVSNASSPAPATPDRAELSLSEIMEVQARLKSLGLNPGPLDGALGPLTVAAIRRYQKSKGQPETGNVDREMLVWLRREPNQVQPRR